jgi:cyclopropane-fatty-acyl-phospholipid synthase
LLLELAERGILPDALIRMGIQVLDRVRLMTEARPDCEATLRAKQDFLARMRQGPVALVPEMANLQHYEVPPEFFQKVLGKNLKFGWATISSQAG